MPDANLFVAAIKHAERHTDSLALLLRLLDDPSIEIVGNEVLFGEYERAASLLPSPLAATLLHQVAEKMSSLDPDGSFVLAVSPYMVEAGAPDIVHAATCLATGATLISNDRDFDEVSKAGLINRLTLTEAVRKLL